MHEKNRWLRDELQAAGIYQYQLAAALGYSETEFVRILREPVKPAIKKKYLNIIKNLAPLPRC